MRASSNRGRSAVLLNSDRTVIVDMVAMDEVQPAVMDVVHMVFMPDLRMVRIGRAMGVVRVQRGVQRRFADRVLRRRLDDVLVEMAVMGEVQMAVVQIVPMVAVPDLLVAAPVAVDMGVVGMDIAGVRVARAPAGSKGCERQPGYKNVTHRRLHVCEPTRANTARHGFLQLTVITHVFVLL